MEAYGYLFLGCVALTIVVAVLTLFSWLRNRMGNRGASSILLALNLLFGGLVILLTIMMFVYFPPADRIDAVFTLAPFVATAVLLTASFILLRKT